MRCTHARSEPAPPIASATAASLPEEIISPCSRTSARTRRPARRPPMCVPPIWSGADVNRTRSRRAEALDGQQPGHELRQARDRPHARRAAAPQHAAVGEVERDPGRRRGVQAQVRQQRRAREVDARGAGRLGQRPDRLLHGRARQDGRRQTTRRRSRCAPAAGRPRRRASRRRRSPRTRPGPARRRRGRPRRRGAAGPGSARRSARSLSGSRRRGPVRQAPRRRRLRRPARPPPPARPDRRPAQRDRPSRPRAPTAHRTPPATCPPRSAAAPGGRGTSARCGP